MRPVRCCSSHRKLVIANLIMRNEDRYRVPARPNGPPSRPGLTGTVLQNQRQPGADGCFHISIGSEPVGCPRNIPNSSACLTNWGVADAPILQLKGFSGWGRRCGGCQGVNSGKEEEGRRTYSANHANIKSRRASELQHGAGTPSSLLLDVRNATGVIMSTSDKEEELPFSSI